MAQPSQLEFVFGRKPLTAEQVRELLHYDPETGVFTWRTKPARRIMVGSIAGKIDHYGYRLIGIGAYLWKAHRLAWLHMKGEWPTEEVDHINGDPADNRWENLRLANHTQNMANAKTRKDNTSGFKGVCFAKREKRWQAGIQVNGRYRFLGQYETPEEAHAAYCKAAQKLFGEFARFK